MESPAITTRKMKPGGKTAFRVSVFVIRWRGRWESQTAHHSLSAAARGGNFKRIATGGVLRNGPPLRVFGQ